MTSGGESGVRNGLQHVCVASCWQEGETLLFVSMQPISACRPTLVYDAGVTLVQGIATAGHGVAHLRGLRRTPAADLLVLTTGTTHDVPLCTGTLVVREPGNWEKADQETSSMYRPLATQRIWIDDCYKMHGKSMKHLEKRLFATVNITDYDKLLRRLNVKQVDESFHPSFPRLVPSLTIARCFYAINLDYPWATWFGLLQRFEMDK